MYRGFTHKDTLEWFKVRDIKVKRIVDDCVVHSVTIDIIYAKSEFKWIEFATEDFRKNVAPITANVKFNLKESKFRAVWLWLKTVIYLKH